MLKNIGFNACRYFNQFYYSLLYILDIRTLNSNDLTNTSANIVKQEKLHLKNRNEFNKIMYLG